jgi:hypothetical protein
MVQNTFTPIVPYMLSLQLKALSIVFCKFFRSPPAPTRNGTTEGSNVEGHVKSMRKKSRAAHLATRIAGVAIGLGALVWFLVRVIPKPSRASYPCQRAAFPLASAFVLWVCSLSGLLSLAAPMRFLARHRYLLAGALALMLAAGGGWLYWANRTEAASRATLYNYAPQQRNMPTGIARGIFPGRVVWARDPKATHWSGNLYAPADQWWMDRNNDQGRVDAMMSATLRKLTGAASDDEAWQRIFTYYNARTRGTKNRGYHDDETVAVKVNLNSSGAASCGNFVNASPQVTLAIVRQLILHAHVPQSKIIVYDAQRDVYPALLTKIWSEFKDVRFLQRDAPQQVQPVNPGYGNHHGLEAPEWVEGVSYSANNYRDAKLIPRQIKEAAYLVNLALLKAHSYPYAAEEGGDEGQTGVTLTGKNQFGSIKGTPELHAAINTDKEGSPHAYSPIVDLAAAPDLGAKTILYLIDGLYPGRRHQSFPQHFPNPPFNNRVEPYGNSDWPASLLASLDGVALDSVSIDILYAQSRNNLDKSGHPRILLRENTDDYLQEEATPDHAPSGTRYVVNGKPTPSLGVFEHWDNDAARQYSRNKDPRHGKGIELIYISM